MSNTKTVESLCNLGKTSGEWLHAVGVHTDADIERLGVIEVYQMVSAAFPDRVTLNMLYALQGALLNVTWDRLPKEMRLELRRQAEESRQ